MMIKDALQAFSKRAWRQHCLSKGLIYLPLILAFGGVSYGLIDLTIGNGLFIAACIVLGLMFFAVIWINFSAKSKQYKARYNLFNCAEHVNQQYPQLEFSCQLALKNNDELSVLQQMQLTRIEPIFAQLLGDDPKLLKPRLIAWRKVFGAWLLWLLIIIFVPHAFNYFDDDHHSANPILSDFNHHSKVTITPPQYTQLPASSNTIGNLTVIEGSTVTWHISTENRQTRVLAPKLKLGDKLIPLKPLDDGRWIVSQTVNQTGLYQLISQQPEGHYTDLYAIAVTKDQAPTIRMLAPTTTLVTFGHDEQPQLTTKALVSDDFAIGEIKLVASLAKGSGEAVKFRDLNVAFDSNEVIDNGEDKTKKETQKTVYKTWDFKALGMEPGDELYFSVHATDNKMPTAQTSRSSTVIVRWLDESQQLVSADGLLLTYMPEYFRSQRQIIIETEQLIADKPQLSQSQINDMSISLGQSQQDLKLRYGQYLGDEVGQGPGEQADFIGGAFEHANQIHEDGGHDHSHSHGESHGKSRQDLSSQESSSQNQVSEKLQQAAAMQAQQEQSHGHEHHQQQGSTLGSEQAVTSAFAHAHEEVHVGEVSTQNPKAMMKKAVSFMWQAELHLLLSEPQKALPFELQAYKYLKLAKQSERIYVKRLGFEPPPVSEDKRLTGELNEIESYQVEKQLVLSDSDNQLFSQAFYLLSVDMSVDMSVDTRINKPRELNLSQQQLLKRLKTRLTELAQTRPALINFALTVEKVLITNGIELADCDDCISLLSAKLWQLIEVPVSEPVKRQAEYLDGDDLATDFMSVLQSRSAP